MGIRKTTSRPDQENPVGYGDVFWVADKKRPKKALPIFLYVKTVAPRSQSFQKIFALSVRYQPSNIRK
jgi:hypothetical protein